MADIGTLVVKIAADASELSKELQKIGEGGTRAASAMKNAGKIMAAAFVAAGTAIVYMTIQAGKAAEELEQLSQITGISTDTLQGYEVAMNRVGLSGQDMTQMMKALSKNLEEAQSGTGEAADRFRQLGIDIRKVTDTDDLIRKVMNSVSQFADGTEKAAIVSSLLGKAGLAWIPAMKDGAKALDEAAEKAKKMGQLSADQIAALTAMDDALDDLSMAWKFFAGNLGALVAPAIQWVTELFVNMLSWASQALKELREFLGMAGSEAPKVSKPKAPPLVDSGKMNAARQSALDARFKLNEQSFADAKALGDAELAYNAALQDQRKALYQKTELEIAKERADIVRASTDNVVSNLELEIENYKLYAEEKKAAYGSDAKSIEARDKFAAESALKLAQLETQLSVARVQGETQRLQAGTAVFVATKGEEMAALDDEIERYAALEEIQQQTYEQEILFSGAAEARRRVRIGAIEAEAEKLRKIANDQIRDAEKLAQVLENIDNRERARKMAAANEFPTFWEKQLNDLQASNVFSMGQMVSTWSSSIATMIVKGGDLKAAWESTQIAIIQGFINMGVSAVATAVKTLIVNEVTATGVAGVWASAAGFVVGVWGTVTTAMATMFTTLVTIVVAVGEAIMGVLSAIGTALGFTGVGAIWAGAILSGVVLIGAALVALKAVKFAKGGIVTGPTLGMLGEAGPEAVIPLGKGNPFGDREDRPIITKVYVDGKQIARATTRHQMSAWRWEGAGA